MNYSGVDNQKNHNYKNEEQNKNGTNLSHI